MERETTSILGIVLQGKLELLCSKVLIPVCGHINPQSLFQSITNSFENVVIDVSGA
jgi:hypothetical protein